MIEVQISAAELGRFGNEVLKGDFVCKKLRKAGIPVIGALWPRGAQNGVLTMASDDSGNLAYAYDGAVEAPAEEPEEEALW